MDEETLQSRELNEALLLETYNQTFLAVASRLMREGSELSSQEAFDMGVASKTLRYYEGVGEEEGLDYFGDLEPQYTQIPVTQDTSDIVGKKMTYQNDNGVIGVYLLNEIGSQDGLTQMALRIDAVDSEPLVVKFGVVNTAHYEESTKKLLNIEKGGKEFRMNGTSQYTLAQQEKLPPAFASMLKELGWNIWLSKLKDGWDKVKHVKTAKGSYIDRDALIRAFDISRLDKDTKKEILLGMSAFIKRTESNDQTV